MPIKGAGWGGDPVAGLPKDGDCSGTFDAMLKRTQGNSAWKSCPSPNTTLGQVGFSQRHIAAINAYLTSPTRQDGKHDSPGADQKQETTCPAPNDVKKDRHYWGQPSLPELLSQGESRPAVAERKPITWAQVEQVMQTLPIGGGGVGMLGNTSKGLLGVAATEGRFVDLARTSDLAPGFYRASPTQIRFGQHVASPNFSNGGTISDLASELIAGKSPDLVGSPLRVIIEDGKAFTLDNRRLVAFNAAGADNIPIQVVGRGDPAIATLLRNPTRMNPIGGEGKYIVIAPKTEQSAARQLLLERGLIK